MLEAATSLAVEVSARNIVGEVGRLCQEACGGWWGGGRVEEAHPTFKQKRWGGQGYLPFWATQLCPEPLNWP